jgi:hypothetical protein
MPSRSPLQLAGVAAVIAMLSAGGGCLQHLREDRYPAPAEAEESLDITSGTVLKHLTAGYNAVAADLYWIRAIQYYGGIKLAVASAGSTSPAHADYRLLYPLLDLTTTLDPDFNIAYRFGEIFLAEPSPGGAGRPDLAIALLEKGLRSRPDKWEYMQDIGFVHYWWQRDYKGAAEWFDRAGKVPGAPWWLKSLAANTLTEGGDRESSRAMWEALRQSAEIDWLRHDAERRLMQLQALDQIDALQAAVDRFAAKAGRPAGDWLSLVRAGVFRGVPLDPVRTPYEIDGAGRVRLSAKSSLYPLPDAPRHIGAPPS